MTISPVEKNAKSWWIWDQSTESKTGQPITPDRYNDWINQRGGTWEALLPLGHEDAKANRPGAPDTAMRLYSLGLATGGDAYLYSYDEVALAERVERMTAFYEQRRKAVEAGFMTLEDATTKGSVHIIKWHADLKRRMERNTPSDLDDRRIRSVHYRPFTKQWLYFDPHYIARKYRMPALFPTGATPNQAIAVSGKSSTNNFSVLITNITSDLELVSKSQVFPRYAYPGKPKRAKRGLSGTNSLIDPSNAPEEHGRIDNITDSCLEQCQDHYNDPTITKDDIWAYLYGVLHAPDWRDKYASELRKDLPRIPFATDFRAFQEAGQQLIDLHLGYETCQTWPLQVVTTGDPDASDLYRIDDAMRWGKVRNTDGKLVLDKSVLCINTRTMPH